MISLMVVDDEELVIRGIQSILKRANHGYVLVGEASNGAEAIEVAVKTRPDLIITDICMPEMNGLSMIYKIKEALPDTKFVILSGYGEFNYAQEAVRLGVIDYLLKPISSNGLYTLLDKIAHEIIKAETKNAMENRRKMESAISGFMFNNIGTDFTLLKEMIGSKTEYIVEILSFGSSTDNDSINYQMAEFIKDYIDKGDNGYSLAKENKIILILRNLGISKIQFINAALSEQLKKVFGVMVFIDSSDESTPLYESRKLYQQAANSCEMRFYEKEPAFYRKWDGILMTAIPIDMVNDHFVDELFQKIVVKEEESAFRFIQTMIEQFCQKHILPNDITRYFHGIIRICLSNLELKGYWREPLSDIFNEKIDYLNSCHSVTELERSLKSILADISSLMEHSSGQTNSRIIMEAKRYIIQNYQHEISLSDVSQSVFISPKYLSDLFKKETGETFLSYITSVRIENAKKELHRYDLKIYEIAALVGYGNPKHFVKVFKKNTGMTPLEYRNSLK